MSKVETFELTCPQCGTIEQAEFTASINVKLNPEMREQFLNGNVNVHTCTQCGTRVLIDGIVLYHDMERKYILVYGPNGVPEERRSSMSNQPVPIPYFKYPLFADSVDEAIALVKQCESAGAPANEAERDGIQETVRQALSA